MAAKWVKRQFLGKGSFGSVFLAEPANSKPLSGPLIAVKSAFFEYSCSLKLEGDILQELRGCPEIVQCFGDDRSVENGRDVYNLLLEYAPGGTLHDLIRFNCGNFAESEIVWYVYTLLKGLCHVHEEGYVHCDIKPSNVLVFPSRNGVNCLKIADFGLAKRGGDCQIYMAYGGLDNNRGTLLYNSPESVAYGYHEAPMDIWSLGCTMVEMLTGNPMWSAYINENDLKRKIADYRDDHLPAPPEYLSKNGKDFLRRCLVKDPRERWTAEMLLNHPFIAENIMPLLPESHGSFQNSPFRFSWISEISLFSTSPEPELYGVADYCSSDKAAVEEFTSLVSHICNDLFELGWVEV